MFQLYVYFTVNCHWEKYFFICLAEGGIIKANRKYFAG